MKSFPSGWKTILSSLGFAKRHNRAARRRPAFSRILRMETIEPRHVLSTITVTTIDDVVDQNDGETSLREAIDLAGKEKGSEQFFKIVLTPSLVRSIAQVCIAHCGQNSGL
jgi:hypothetical protein